MVKFRLCILPQYKNFLYNNIKKYETTLLLGKGKLSCFIPHWRAVRLVSSPLTFRQGLILEHCCPSPGSAMFSRSPGSSSWQWLAAKGWGPGVLTATRVLLMLGPVTKIKGSEGSTAGRIKEQM